MTEQERVDRTARAVEQLLQCRQLAATADQRGDDGLGSATGQAHEQAAASDERERLAREELVLANVEVAAAIAARYRNRGEPREELVQTAYVGLVKAANGFTPEHGSDFLAYAVPTIAGEVKRYFRDHGWAVRPPRRIQELHLTMNHVRPELEARLGRSATVAELATEMGVDEDDVIEALAGEQGYRSVSLDAPPPGTDSGSAATLADSFAVAEHGFDTVEDLVSLRPLLAALPPRERRILALRFFDELTQQQIGEQVGVTQMQVSRLITRTLAHLREQLLAA